MPERDSTFCSCCALDVDYEFVVLSAPRDTNPAVLSRQLAHANVLAKLCRAHDHDDARRTTKRTDPQASRS